MSTFDDFDTKVTAEEFYKDWTEDEADYHAEHRDESLMGGKYHGPSNAPGLTAREYWDTYNEWQDEQDRLRDEW